MTLNWLGDLQLRYLHREVPSTRNTLLNTIYRRQLDGRAFRNDPDVFLLRDDNMKLTRKQREALALVNALFASVRFTSDNVGDYDPDKRAIYDRLSRKSAKSPYIFCVFEHFSAGRGKPLPYGESGTQVTL